MSEAAARETITYGELHDRCDALVARLSPRFSKATLLYVLVSDTVARTWELYRSRAAIDEAEAELVERLKQWEELGRLYNRTKRSLARMAKLDALLAGEKPRRRRRRRISKEGI